MKYAHTHVQKSIIIEFHSLFPSPYIESTDTDDSKKADSDTLVI